MDILRKEYCTRRGRALEAFPTRLYAVFIGPIVRILMIYIKDVSKNIAKIFSDYNPNYWPFGPFSFRLGLVLFFPTPIGHLTYTRNKTPHVNFRLVVLRRP
jgi:hypothetical protein